MGLKRWAGRWRRQRPRNQLRRGLADDSLRTATVSGERVVIHLQQEWIVVLLALQLIVGLTLGRRFCLPCRLWFDVLQPRLGEGAIEDARVPRFANVIGAVFLTASSVLLYAGYSTLGWALALIVAALALLATVTGLCVGCELYMLLARARGIAVDRHPAV